jgi:hypothetical protein
MSSSGFFIPNNGEWTLYLCIPNNTTNIVRWSGCVEALDTSSAIMNGYLVKLSSVG